MSQTEKSRFVPNVPDYEERAEKYKSAGFWGRETFDVIFDRAAEKYRDKIAVIDDYGQLTYQQLKNQIDTVATNLSRQGIGRGDVVTVQLPNWKESLVAIHAVSRLGAVCMPISPNSRLLDLSSMMQRAGAKALIIAANFLKFDFADMAVKLKEQVKSIEHVWVVGEGDRHGLSSWSDLMKPMDQPIPSVARPEEIYMLYFSSGTTGAPKGIMHSHNTWLWGLRMAPLVYRMTPEDVDLIVLPVMMTYGIAHACSALQIGGRVILSERYVVDRMVELIVKHDVTFLPVAPPHVFDLIKYVENHPGVKITTMRTLQVGGGPTPPELLRKVNRYFGSMVLSEYGMSEQIPLTATTADTPIERVSTSVGWPSYPASEIKLVDENGKLCPIGVPGEIFTRGPALFLGYYGDPEQTAATFTSDGWFKTGDLGVNAEDGLLNLVGRKKEMIVRGGLNIDPKEIEGLLTQHPKVGQVAIIGMPDERMGEKVCACIIPKSQDQAPTLDEIVSFLREKGLPSQKLTQQLEIMKEFPITPTFKVRKTIMRDNIIKKAQKR
ncbi:MAG: AMP-binding protein [Syntrophales bacterium]|nr:AMP-binding protein [Syntrophales bacterium]